MNIVFHFVGYDYAGMQSSVQCFCGNGYGTYGRLEEAKCDEPCIDDKEQKCGGHYANSVYVVPKCSCNRS